MITLKGGSAIYEGTSGDSKPTAGIDVNTLYHELDTNKWYYFKTDSTWGEVPNTGGGGGGFTPTEEQLAAMNSGITSIDVEQIGTNKNNISTNTTNISSVIDWLNTVGNLSPLYSATSGAQSFIVDSTPISLAAGTYLISWQTTATTGLTQIFLFNGNTEIFNEIVSNGTTTSVTATISTAASKLRMYTTVANTLYDIKVIKQ